MSDEAVTDTASHPGATGENVNRLEDLLQPAMDEVDTIAFRGGTGIGHIPTGFSDLDALTTGLMPGSLTVIGGYPGTGSSTLAMDFTRSAAVRHHIPALYLTLDSPHEKLVIRLLSSESTVNHGDMRTGRMSE